MARKRRKKQQSTGSTGSRKQENLSFQDWAQLMSRKDTFERRGGKMKPRRYGQ